MDIAVLSDIHGNHIALKRCVEYALEQGIGHFLFLGDYAGELASGPLKGWKDGRLYCCSTWV